MTADAGANTGEDAASERGDVPVEDPRLLARGYVRATAGIEGDPRRYRDALAAVDPETLSDALDGDDARLAFWLNVYNASVQDHLSREPELFEKRGFPPRRLIFTRDLVTVAGESLSVDDVEHGILRRSQRAWGLGYLPRLRPSAFERRHRVDALDPRIHFALNCGARSCPPVLEYTADGVADELDRATASYLDAEVDYDPGSGEATVPRLFSWYRGDFGGKRGIRSFLREHDAIPADADPRLRWRDYDWTLKLGQYADA